MKAATEAGVLDHMGRQYHQWGRKLSGTNASWVAAKVRALDVLLQDASKGDTQDEHEVFRFLDVGIGDMMHWAQWAPFTDGSVDYLGVDACADVLTDARAKHGERDNVLFMEWAFSDLVRLHREGHTWPVDCIVALDVLYHVPDDVVYSGMMDLLFTEGEHRYVLVSYATHMSQKFNAGKKPGDPGYAWFPRPFNVPEGWESIHREASRGAPQHQELQLLRRS